ncbi:hypothetical protein AALP_AA6G132400 [Arabis alpina]|uniref:CS domain-containing protein n=1 Tax=Arabis alpina TaxID=50452 RepID=A0A087GNY9_ARAAL|nr:hypothetical protein AALP_AA6G132400 [Arabis alpina]
MTDSEKAEQIVYISCLDEIRYSFVSHLSDALRRKGIVVFVDSDDLLSNEAQAMVKRARVSVMVLTGNLEPTTACLIKLVNVIRCQRNHDQVVVPVCYGIGTHERGWLDSLLKFSGSSQGHQSRKECSDSKLVKEIVRDVYEKLFYMERIGIYPKLLEIENIIRKQPLGIRCLGIWGMPGIGKTTLAKAVFDQMSCEYDAYCFIEDYDRVIREKESFLGWFDWFGPESLIIITSRDKQVFCLCQVDQIYEVHGLNEKEALQLFFLSASIKDMAEQNLHELSMKVIKYANGNPLALNIYGRELKENRVRMHNLTQYVGREIINGETVQIERRSRLWEPSSIKYLLEETEHKVNVEPKTIIQRAQGTEEIEGMFLDTSNLSFDAKPAAFQNMLNLRLLKIYCSDPEAHPVINFPKGIHSLPKELRLLHWEHYPLQSLPPSFDPMHLVEINMPYSQLQTLWDGTKNLETLRTIRLCHSQQLVDIGDLSKAENLEVVDLQGCPKLQSFPATGVSNLEHSDLERLKSLMTMGLSSTQDLVLETVQGFPRNVKELYLAGTALPMHYTFSNCFDLSPQAVNDFLVKVLVNVKHMPREHQQEPNRALAFSFCAPSHVNHNSNSTLDLQLGSSVMTQLNTSWRNTLVGFTMLVEVAFSEDYYNASDKALFLYIACLFNDDDVDLVAPLIARIDLDISSGLKALANSSVIHVSSNRQIVMHSWLRNMGKEILHKESIMEAEVSSPAAPAKPMFRHEYYQTPEKVVVTIFTNGILPKQNINVEFGVQILSVVINVASEEAYYLQLRLFKKIIPEKCRYEVLSTKVQIHLAKAEIITWASLDYGKEQAILPKPNVASAVSQKPVYPSSKPGKKFWDELEAEAKKQEKDEKLDGDAAMTKFIIDVYQNADEDLRRAKNKSFAESNRTVLSTNWKEVGAKKVESTPPAGMVIKKWEC